MSLMVAGWSGIAVRAGIVVVLAVLTTWIGDPMVRWVFARAGLRPEPPAKEPLVVTAEQTLHGGRLVGFLERLGTFATILAGFPLGIAAIVAIKGLARFPELKAENGSGELFLLGTLTSLLVAAGGAGLAFAILRMLG